MLLFHPVTWFYLYYFWSYSKIKLGTFTGITQYVFLSHCLSENYAMSMLWDGCHWFISYRWSSTGWALTMLMKALEEMMWVAPMFQTFVWLIDMIHSWMSSGVSAVVLRKNNTRMSVWMPRWLGECQDVGLNAKMSIWMKRFNLLWK